MRQACPSIPESSPTSGDEPAIEESAFTNDESSQFIKKPLTVLDPRGELTGSVNFID